MRLVTAEGPLVVCDVGDVLMRTVPGAQYRALERRTGVARTSIARLVRACGIDGALERGELSVDAFTEALASLVNSPDLQVGEVREAWESVLAGVDANVAEPAARLAAAGRLVLASNTNLLHWPVVRQALCRTGVTAPAYLSFQLGYTKPDRRFFAAVAADLPAVLTSGTLFIDDRPENVEAAVAYGMTGLLHRNPTRTAAQLNALADGAVPLTRGT